MIHQVAVFGQLFVLDVDPPMCRIRSKNIWSKRMQSMRCPIVCVRIVRCRDDTVDYFDMHFVDNSQPIVEDSLQSFHLIHHRRLWAHRWRIFAPALLIFLEPPSTTATASYHHPYRPGRRWRFHCHRCTSAASFSNVQAHHAHQLIEWMSLVSVWVRVVSATICPAIRFMLKIIKRNGSVELISTRKKTNDKCW